jgi:hypothetical protein
MRALLRHTAEGPKEGGIDLLGDHGSKLTGPKFNEEAYFARTRFSKKAFAELRGACVNQGGRMTEQFLELEDEIDSFASGAQERSIAPDDQALIGRCHI